MPRVSPRAMPNWCLQVTADEPWTGRCVNEKTTAGAVCSLARPLTIPVGPAY